MTKKTIAVFFGGQSSEHEVSCKSVQNIAGNIDTDKYDIVLVGITKDGHWLLCDSLEDVKSGAWQDSRMGAVLSPDATEKCLILSNGEKVAIDVAYPALHGTQGEDGTIQGLFELAKLPYVGSGVLSSSASMDKYYTKIIVDNIGTVNQAAYELVLARKLPQKMDEYVERIEKRFEYPVFIKPCCGGSSCGVSKAENRDELKEGLLEAARYDRKILVEECIKGHEIECAVLGVGDDVKASGVGEILAADQFYSYDAKYNNPQSQTITDPDIPKESVEKVRKDAVDIFKALDCRGYSRVDFFVQEDGKVIFNEINTLPGFTAISMYPMLWNARGIDKKALVNRIIELAFEKD